MTMLSRTQAHADLLEAARSQPFELTERERSLIGWALRSKLVEPRFYNLGMKAEVRELANRISPINWEDE